MLNYLQPEQDKIIDERPTHIQISDTKPPCLYQDYKQYINKIATEKWNNIWKTKPSKIHDLIPNFNYKIQDNTLNRRDQVVMTRLRIGHTNLTHGHLMDKSPPKMCDECNIPITVKHLLYRVRVPITVL